MEKALEIIGLNKVYRNNVRALENINLTVEKGDLFAFLGPNGAGKSTVIGIISSLVRITSGDVYVLGENIKKNPDFAKRNIGLALTDWIKVNPSWTTIVVIKSVNPKKNNISKLFTCINWKLKFKLKYILMFMAVTTTPIQIA